MTQPYYKGSQIFFLCFALDDPESYQKAVTDFLSDIIKFSPDNKVLYIVGMKQDKIQSMDQINFIFKATEDVRGAEAYHISSKTNEGIKEILEDSAQSCQNIQYIDRQGLEGLQKILSGYVMNLSSDIESLPDDIDIDLMHRKLIGDIKYLEIEESKEAIEEFIPKK